MQFKFSFVFLLWALLVTTGLQAEPRQARGVVKSLDRAMLSAEISARVVRMPFREGDSFKKGQNLVVFDCRLFKAQYDKVTSEVTAAKAKLENDKRLDKVGSIGKLDIVLSQAKLDASQAELRLARINKERCNIKAPWNGRVVSRQINVQESAELNQPLLEIVSKQNLELEVVVPGTWLSWLAVGTSFTVRIDETGEEYQGTVKVIGSAVHATSQTVSLRTDISGDTQKLLPGMSGTVLFSSSESKLQ